MRLLALIFFCFLLVGLSYSMSVQKHDHAAIGFNHDERNPACRGRGPPPPPPPQRGGNDGSCQTGEQESVTAAAISGNF